MLPTDLTVSAVVERDGHFLIVEERSSGVIVLNQPGGHIESAEAPEDATIRECLEEAGCEISISGLLGVYLWIHPQTRQNFLRIVYTANLVKQHHQRTLDAGIHAVHWYSLADIRNRKRDVRSPIVIQAIEDYLDGKRQPDSYLDQMMPLHQNVHEVLAAAQLV